MPSYDEYGSGWDPTSRNPAQDYARYVDNGGFSRSSVAAQNVPGARVDNWGGPSIPRPDYLPPDANWVGSVQHDDPDLLTRIWRSLFGGGPEARNAAVQQQPGQGASRQLNYGPGPADSSPFVPPPPAAKPASQIASSKAITDKINNMLLPPYEPPRVFSAEIAPEIGARNAPFSYAAVDPRLQQSPFDLLRSGPTPDRRGPSQTVDLRRPTPTQASMASPFGSFLKDIFGVRRADGGQLPGFMRGGYPDLYPLDVPPGIPERTFFDSGGQNYVDNGTGSGGRADDVNARLSEKEYVMTAEDMALLGDGNPDAGAKKMDHLRVQLRKHKGKELAKGKISADAKNPMEYLVGNPMGDGLRRRGRERG